MKVTILASGTGWHYAQLARAFERLGAEVSRAPVTRLRAWTGETRTGLGAGDLDLRDSDAVVVRTIPPGSLEQVIFRMDALQRLQARGTPVYNSARAVERTVDKYLATDLLDAAGLPVPATAVAEDCREALELLDQLGGDVVVKPLFGSLGRGLMRVDNPDLAYRVFRTLEISRAVFYLQRFVPHPNRDLRALVVDGEVAAAMARSGSDWRTNLARGALPRPWRLTAAQEKLAVEAAAAVGTFYAGVDLLEDLEGNTWVLEVNGIPGWEGLQQVSDVDLAGVIAGGIARKLRQSEECES